MTQHTALSASPIDVEALTRAVHDPGSGAIATFSGVVRDTSDGKPVLRLEYEAYAPLAEQELRRIADEVQKRHGLHGVGIVHRTGTLEVGEVAVVVVASSAHRAAALAACAEAIDLVKRDVPIWKREHHPDGAVWVDCTLHSGAEA
jgi:molybdopterin synthase catalytic subunit